MLPLWMIDISWILLAYFWNYLGAFLISHCCCLLLNTKDGELSASWSHLVAGQWFVFPHNRIHIRQNESTSVWADSVPQSPTTNGTRPIAWSKKGFQIILNSDFYFKNVTNLFLWNSARFHDSLLMSWCHSSMRQWDFFRCHWGYAI